MSVIQQPVLFILLLQMSIGTTIGRLGMLLLKYKEQSVIILASIVCPRNATRLVNIDDIEAVAQPNSNQGRNFSGIVNTRRDYLSEWYNYVIPNQGNLTLKHPFVIEQLSTRGRVYRVSGEVYESTYVSNFSLSYQSSSLTDGIVMYPQVHDTDRVGQLDESAFSVQNNEQHVSQNLSHAPA